jgi:hypothetical protein
MTPAEIYKIYSQEGGSLRSTAAEIQKLTGTKMSYWTVRQRLVKAGYELKPVGNPELEQTDAPLEAVQGRVEPDIKAWLQEQPEGESYHVREALRQYFKAKTRKRKS